MLERQQAVRYSWPRSRPGSYQLADQGEMLGNPPFHTKYLYYNDLGQNNAHRNNDHSSHNS